MVYTRPPETCSRMEAGERECTEGEKRLLILSGMVTATHRRSCKGHETRNQKFKGQRQSVSYWMVQVKDGGRWLQGGGWMDVGAGGGWMGVEGEA